MSEFEPTEEHWNELDSYARRLSLEMARRLHLPPEVGTFEDALQEFLLWLHQHPSRIQYITSLNGSHRFYVFRQMFQWNLRKLRGRTELENLLGRVRDLGKRGSFERISTGGGFYYSRKPQLVESPPMKPTDVRRLAHLCHAVPQLVVNSDSERHSMVYTTSDLKLLMGIIFDASGGIHQSDLREVFKILLTGRTPRDVSLDEGGTLTGMSNATATVRIAMEELATTICNRLSLPIQAALFASLQETPQETTAKCLGVTRQTVASYTKKGVQIMRLYQDEVSPDEYSELSKVLVWRLERGWVEATHGMVGSL